MPWAEGMRSLAGRFSGALWALPMMLPAGILGLGSVITTFSAPVCSQIFKYPPVSI